MSATSAKRAVTWWYTSVVFGVSVADEHWQNSGFDFGLLVASSALAFGRGDDVGCDAGSSNASAAAAEVLGLFAPFERKEPVLAASPDGR